VVGGIYWLTASSDKQTENTAVVQKEPIPEQPAVDSHKSPVTSPEAAAGSATAMQPPAHQPTAGTATPPENKASNQTGNWIIDLASVNSDKSARQHVARIRAMGVESRVVQITDKGRIYHHIRVGGFSSQQAAKKRRDALVKLLGLRDATVEKL